MIATNFGITFWAHFLGGPYHSNSTKTHLDAALINTAPSRKFVFSSCAPSKHSFQRVTHYPTGIYLLKVNNRNTRTRYEICSKLTIKLPERREWRHSGISIVNLEYISQLVLVFLLLTLNM